MLFEKTNFDLGMYSDLVTFFEEVNEEEFPRTLKWFLEEKLNIDSSFLESLATNLSLDEIFEIIEVNFSKQNYYFQ